MTAKASWTGRIILSVAGLLLTLRHPALTVRSAMKLGYLPNPAAPKTYHEMLLWRKIVDRNPLFVTLTDKLAAKAHIRSGLPAPAPQGDCAPLCRRAPRQVRELSGLR